MRPRRCTDWHTFRLKWRSPLPLSDRPPLPLHAHRQPHATQRRRRTLTQATAATQRNKPHIISTDTHTDQPRTHGGAPHKHTAPEISRRPQSLEEPRPPAGSSVRVHTHTLCKAAKKLQRAARQGARGGAAARNAAQTSKHATHSSLSSSSAIRYTHAHARTHRQHDEKAHERRGAAGPRTDGRRRGRRGAGALGSPAHTRLDGFPQRHQRLRLC